MLLNKQCAQQCRLNNSWLHKILLLNTLYVYLLVVTCTPLLSTNNHHKQKLQFTNNVLINNYKHEVTAITSATVTYINNGQMLARQVNNNGLQNYITNAKGSVLKLNNAASKNIYQYNYDAYGNVLPARVTRNARRQLTANRFQYNGEPTDLNTGLQYLRARFYYLELKRFINQDSYDLLNRLGYVVGNPIMNIDPSGHMPSRFPDIAQQNTRSRRLKKITGPQAIEKMLNKNNLSGYKITDFCFLDGTEQRFQNIIGITCSGSVFYNLSARSFTFQGWNFNGCTAFNARVSGGAFLNCNLNKVDLSSSEISGSTITVSDFSESILELLRLEKVDLVEINCTSANLKNAILINVTSNSGNFSNANCAGSKILNSSLLNANFTSANLDTVRFENTDLSFSNFDGAKIRLSTMIGVNLCGVTLNNADILSLRICKYIIIDSNFAGRSRKNNELADRIASYQASLRLSMTVATNSNSDVIRISYFFTNPNDCLTFL